MEDELENGMIGWRVGGRREDTYGVHEGAVAAEMKRKTL